MEINNNNLNPSNSAWMTEIIEKIQKVNNKDEIFPILLEVKEYCNFNYMLYGITLPISFNNSQLEIQSDYPKSWLEEYLKNDDIKIDPIVKYGRNSFQPIIWSALLLETKQEIDFLQNKKQAGLYDGISYPIGGSKGEEAILSLSCSKKLSSNFLNSELSHLIFLLSRIIHEKYFSFIIPDITAATLSNNLSVREIECLSWLADGKTSWEISKILSISEHTASTHINKVVKKLSANNRTHAVAIAIQRKLIQPAL